MWQGVGLAAEEQGRVDLQEPEWNQYTSVSLLDFDNVIWFAFDLDCNLINFQFTPFAVNEVLHFIFVELFLPEVRVVGTGSRATPGDVIASSNRDHRDSGQLTAGQNLTIG